MQKEYEFFGWGTGRKWKVGRPKMVAFLRANKVFVLRKFLLAQEGAMITMHKLEIENIRNPHKWSGWPGAYCLNCGASDPIEEALADNSIDLITGECISEEVAVSIIRRLECKAVYGNNVVE